MKKLFYLVNASVLKNYTWTKLIRLHKSFRFEDKFWLYLRNEKNLRKDLGAKYVLWSISEDTENDFILSCKKNGIELIKINVEKHYDDFNEQNKVYTPSKQENIPTEDMLIICSKEVPEIICCSGTRQKLEEHVIKKRDNITLYIRSNEMSGHKIPHCHVKYKNENNYCVLSLVNCEKIAPDGNKKNAVIKKAEEILSENIQEARKKWNGIKSQVKFKQSSDGSFTSELI